MHDFTFRLYRYGASGPPLKILDFDPDSNHDDNELMELIVALRWLSVPEEDILKALTKIVGRAKAEKLLQIGSSTAGINSETNNPIPEMHDFIINLGRYRASGPPLKVLDFSPDRNHNDNELLDLIMFLRYLLVPEADILKALTEIVGQAKAEELLQVGNSPEASPSEPETDSLDFDM